MQSTLYSLIKAFFLQEQRVKTKNLKELWNCTLRIILAWSLFCLMFNTGLCRSAFSTTSFRKLIFHLSVLSVFFCFESNVLNQDVKLCCHHLRRSSCCVILFSFYKNSRRSRRKKAVIKNFTILTWKQLCWSLFLVKL